MLSPKAMNLVTPSVGTNGRSDTVNEHAAFRVCVAESRPVQETVVDPSEKVVPEAGVQLTKTGSTPPVWGGVP
jgi:hypothetical protein